MSLREWLFGSSDSEDERPPKPDDFTKTETFENTLLTVKLSYHSGDTEEIECYGFGVEDSEIAFQTEPELTGTRIYGIDPWKYVRRPLPTLTRPPEVIDEQKELHTVTIRKTHHWSGSTWREEVRGYDVDIEPIGENDD